MSAATTASEHGARVAVLSKEKNLIDSNTRWAQGGIVGESSEDTQELLAEDILTAGGEINSVDAVRLLVREGPGLTRSFLRDKIHVPFTEDENGEPALTMEAAHSVRRIFYAKDRTGDAIQRSLIRYLEEHPEIEVFSGCTAIDFITNVHNSRDPQEKYRQKKVLGVYAVDEETASVSSFFAPAVVLATGGIGNLFRHTSNPRSATGDGIAMAYRVGEEVLNAEYVQFHPTILHHRDVKRFLISEALRGEGAKLVNHSGEDFMQRYSPEQSDLSPRDEVARAIYREMEREDFEYVWLDATRIRGMDLEERFPGIFKQCYDVGIDIRKDLIPVVPAAHYFCGGVKVDLDGRTSIQGLYAAGETSCTGVHGANRLASISLLEGLVWGVRCGRHAALENRELPDSLVKSIPDWIVPGSAEEVDPVLVNQDIKTIQSTMWNYSGIIRSGKRLQRALADLEYLRHRVEQFYRGVKLTRTIIELRNSVLTASLIVRAALANPKPKGCHYIEHD